MSFTQCPLQLVTQRPLGSAPPRAYRVRRVVATVSRPALTPEERAGLRALVDAATRAAIPGPEVGARCLGAATEARYREGCKCPDCLQLVTRLRRERRQRQAAEGRLDTLMPKIRRHVRRYPIPGAAYEDGLQVALLALEEAKASYDPAKGVWEAHAYDCVKRRLYDARLAANRLKHQVLTLAITEATDGMAVLELLPRRAPDPYEVVVARLELAAVVRALSTLTELERLALSWVLNGESYAGSREVDNAVYRARRKLRAAAVAA